MNDDLAIIKAIFSGHTQDSAAGMLGISKDIIKNRLKHLRLGFYEGRKAMIEGATAEEYLRTSPVYKKNKAAPEKVKLALRRGRAAKSPAKFDSKDFTGFYGLLFVPEENRQSPAFHLYAAQRLEDAASELRSKAAKLLQDKMGGSLKNG